VIRLLAGHHCAALWTRLRLSQTEIRWWERISRRLRVVFHDGVISQFAGYADLPEFDWVGYRRRYGDLLAIDSLLRAEGDTANRYRLSKQADVLMLLYLLSAEELRDLFGRLGYPLDAATVARTVEYYLARVAHGSSLSRIAHSWVQARANREQSWQLFTEALGADLADGRGGSTRSGVHLGAMAGTIDLAMRCYTGLETRADVLYLHRCCRPSCARCTWRCSIAVIGSSSTWITNGCVSACGPAGRPRSASAWAAGSTGCRPAGIVTFRCRPDLDSRRPCIVSP
jgi:trehalose/maltose hydrolase-like predicted phosphorylase